MNKILKRLVKRLVKCKSSHDKKYSIIYKRNPYREYGFMYCDEKELKKMLIDNVMFDYHIFLAKDELEFETEIKMEEE